MTIEKMNAQRFHCSSSIIAQRTCFNEIILANMLILEMGAHRNLPLKAAIADRTVIGQRFGVRRKVLSQVIFAKESFLAHTTFVRLNTGVAHFVSSHICTI